MTHTSSALCESLDTLNAALQGLVEDLDKERDALRQRASADDLESIAAHKATAVERVASLYTRMREALVSVTGNGRIEDAMTHLRSREPGLITRVEMLVELIRTCQLANQENGALIGAGLRSTGSALDTLCKLSAAGANATYSASGQAESGAGTSQRLAVRA